MRVVGAVLTVCAGVVALTACAGGPAGGVRTVTVFHADGIPGAVFGGEPGGLGTCRVFSGPVTFDGLGPGSLAATMMTTAVDRAAGTETRVTLIVFMYDADQSQLVVEGAAVYPTTSAVIGRAVTVTRPVLGGSGAWTGARGSVVTTHLEDGSWKHTFTLLP